MTIANRRAFRRFDIIAVLEFKLMTALAGTFAGITNNFSYEGFCVETQCATFEPGDNLELSLSHPHSDLTVSVPASVVWKKTADKFACLMGLKLKETELDKRLRMLEIMSAAGDVPVDSFLSDGSDEGTGDEETPSTAPYSDPLKKDIAVPEPEGTQEEDIEDESFRDEGLLGSEKNLLTGNKSGNFFNEVFKAAQTEGPEAEDMLDEEVVKSDMTWPGNNDRKDETYQALAGSNHLLKQLLGNKTFIYTSITAVIIGISVYALFLIFQRPGNGIKSPAPVPAQSAFQQEQEQSNILPPVQDAGHNEAVPAIQVPDEHRISNSKILAPEVPAVLPVPPTTRTTDNKTRYIQVGAWRNPDNAREMLQKLKKYYPDAYLTPGKSFNKIKIPVTDKTRASKIMKDIEVKFKLKSFLTPEK